MGKHGGTYFLLFVFISFFSFVSFVFAQEASFQEMLQTVRRAGEEVRALQFQMQRVLGPMIPPDEMSIFSTLRFGMRGEEVRALQELLRRDREIYPEGFVTGYFGVLTDNAVKRFQAAQGLQVTGVVDSWTRAYLRGFSRVAPPFVALLQDVASVPEEVQDVALSLEPEIVSLSTPATSTPTLSISTSTPTSTVSSGGSGGGGSPTVQSSGSSGGFSGGSGGSSPAPSTPSDTSISEIVTTSTLVVATSTSVSTATSTAEFVSTSTPSLVAVSPTSTDSVSSTTVSIVSSTVSVSSDDDADDDHDYDPVESLRDHGASDDTDKKEEKIIEKEMRKAEKAVEKVEKKKDEGGAVVEEIKLEIQEVSASNGAFSNLATILNSLSGLLGRMSSFFK